MPFSGRAAGCREGRRELWLNKRLNLASER
jgi:hypothetical protein